VKHRKPRDLVIDSDLIIRAESNKEWVLFKFAGPDAFAWVRGGDEMNYPISITDVRRMIKRLTSFIDWADEQKARKGAR